MSAGVQDFIAAMAAAGVVPAEPIAGKLLSGKLIRFRCEGDGKKRNGWARYFDGQRPGGVYGNHKQNTGSISWQAAREHPLSPDERRALRETVQAEAARRERETAQAQDDARRAAMRLWSEAGPADAAHPYAAKKRLRLGGLRQSGEALLVPMRDADGRLWNLQRIFPDGSKRFLKGGRIIGLCAVIGLRPEFSRAVFAEGYATGEAISQALGDRPVIVAFNTANLEPVVAEWSRRHPGADWVIAADDDHLTGLKMQERGWPYQNPGVDKAREVAAAHGCRVAYPPSVRARRWGVASAENVDFSDLLLAGDAEAIRGAVRAALRVRERELAASGSVAVGRQGVMA